MQQSTGSQVSRTHQRACCIFKSAPPFPAECPIARRRSRPFELSFWKNSIAPRDLWNDWTDDQLFQASTSDPLGLCKSKSSAPEAVPSTEPQDTSYATISWNTSCNWHQGWTHNDAWAAETLQVAPSPPPCRCPMNIVERQVHDPWRKNTAG